VGAGYGCVLCKNLKLLSDAPGNGCTPTAQTVGVENGQKNMFYFMKFDKFEKFAEKFQCHKSERCVV
jgi:hypothetical protein